jgi:dephospho-CoA kinase
MNKTIIGLVGEIASGKDEAAKFLTKEYGSITASFSQPLRDTLDILGLPQDRDNMINLGIDLRERFGQDILAKAVLRMVNKSDAPVACLPNVRLLSDITVFENLPGFHLIRIDADEDVRFKRLCNRGQNPDDATKTWEEFLVDSQKPTEIAIRETAKHAQFSIENNTCIANLHKQVRAIMRVITGGE